MLTIKKEEFVSVLKDLIKFEATIDKYYKLVKEEKEDNKPKKECGYLMNKRVLDDLKKKLYFSNFKNLNHNLFYKNFKEIFKDLEEITFEGGEQKTFKDYKEMEKDLKINKNEYVIVSKTIWDFINNGNKTEYEGKFTYEINSKNLILYLNDEEKAFFKHDSNIINYKNLLHQQDQEANIIIINDIEEEVEKTKIKTEEINLTNNKEKNDSLKK